MKQYEFVIQTMTKLGGYSTLAQLYKLVDTTSWKTKTPFATIRRIVQDERFFFRIKPGLWALNDYRTDVFNKLDLILDDKKSNEKFEHSYYQGLLVELGNMKGFKTFIPNQDKNKKFLDKSLSTIASIQNILPFTYQEVLNRAKTVDAIWFNERNFPNSLFEVEHSTDFQNSLGKYHDLQDFNTQFYVVSHISKKKQYQQIIERGIFKDLTKRVKFIDYDTVSEWHTRTSELLEIQSRIKF